MTHRYGKSAAQIYAAKIACLQGKTVAFATTDQESMVAHIQRQEPGTLCEIVGDSYVVPHFKKTIIE